VRVARELGRVEADEIEELGDARAPLRARARLVDDERLLDDGADAHPRVERRVRVLKHDLHVAPRLPQPLARKAEDVFLAEAHRA
jgi:hypothetical protein